MLNGFTTLKTQLNSAVKIPIRILFFLLVLIGLGLISLVVYTPYLPYTFSVQLGTRATSTIESPKYFEFETKNDQTINQSLIKDATQKIERIYTLDTNINKKVRQDIEHFFSIYQTYIKEKPIKTPPPADLDLLPKKFITLKNAHRHLGSSEIKYVILQNIDQLLNKGIKQINTPNIKQQIKKNTAVLSLKPLQEQFIYTTIIHFIKPNLIFNADATNKAIQNAIDSIDRQKTAFKKDDPIVYQNELITQTHIDALNELGLIGIKANSKKLLGICFTCLFFFILVERFIVHFHPKLRPRNKYYVLIYLVVLLVLVAGILFKQIPAIPKMINIYFLIPIPIAAMILTSLVSPYIAFVCGVMISFLIAMMYQTELSFFLYLFFSFSVALFAIHKKYKRSDFIFAGYLIGGFNVCMVIILGVFQEYSQLSWFGLNCLVAFANGILSAMVSLAILPYLESLFKITTYQTLLELSNIHHPLLKNLLVSAPGTYQHSLIVANLAEVGAEAIGANPLLARIGAYFHDIGKAKRPIFFSENQLTKENPHDVLDPQTSKLMISSHIKDGTDLAKKHKLPQCIQNFIQEHHGTALVSFFYSKALNNDKKAKEEDYRYNGPKPQFKESGILMLADSVEAAVRSLDKPDQTKIEAIINKIINEKVADGQLDDCPLSLKEITTIKKSFADLFMSLHHNRINYEEEVQKLINQKKTKIIKAKKENE